VSFLVFRRYNSKKNRDKSKRHVPIKLILFILVVRSYCLLLSPVNPQLNLVKLVRPVCKILIVIEVGQEVFGVHLSPLHPGLSPLSLGTWCVIPIVIYPHVGLATWCGVGGRASSLCNQCTQSLQTAPPRRTDSSLGREKVSSHTANGRGGFRLHT
jgi:hypothetical protein